MASTASSSRELSLAAASSSTLDARTQAGSLPAKAQLVGEIGYQAIPERRQDLDEVDLGDGAALNAAEFDALNGRHPAERSNPNPASQSSTSLPIPGHNGATQPNSSRASSLNTIDKHSIFSFRSFTSKRYKGATLPTSIRLVALFLFLCGVLCGWIVVAVRFKPPPSASSSTTLTSSPNMGPIFPIFIHIAFALSLLIAVIFFERSIFQFRAERYAHYHPGEVLPSHYNRTPTSPTVGMGFAPWNRPALPTYAAALGVRGTGDVEDNIIAAPPPPEYGNTRESTLILSSFLRQSRTSQRSRISGHRRGPSQGMREAGNSRMSEVTTRSLPISYAEVEHQGDIERARMLEEALARLESNIQSTSSPSNGVAR